MTGKRLPMNGVELLQQGDPETVTAVRDVLLDRARRARTDPVVFFELVMEEQTTRRPIKLAPHQKVLLEFVLAHQYTVNMLPVGASKTFLMAGLTLWLMGQDPTVRGAIVSATRTQAEKVLLVVRDYIETSWKLQLVFPELVPSQRQGDPWTQSALTIARPAGIPDPTLVAHGIDSGTITGSRLSWVVVDDILNDQNTRTQDQRQTVKSWFQGSVFDRMDKGPYSKIVVTNVPWHPDDLVHQLESEEMGWPSLRMDILGYITVKDDKEREIQAAEDGVPFVPWDSKELRPASESPSDFRCRLKAHDPDPKCEVPLWPEGMLAPRDQARAKELPRERVLEMANREIAKLRRQFLPDVFNRRYMGICRADETAPCKQEFVDLCKRLARERKVYQLGLAHYAVGMQVFTGVDLAISPGEEHDKTAFFTFGVTHDHRRLILDVEQGQWSGPEILRRIVKKHEQYNSVVCVENNAAQEYLIQFLRKERVDVPVKGYTTGRSKAHPEHGVPALFLEMANGAWLIPNDTRGQCQPQVQEFVDACLHYLPSKHTADVLMACFFARELAHDWGLLSGGDTAELPGADPVGPLLVR